MTDSQPAQPSRAFWRISPRRLSKLSARSFSMICSAVRSPTRGKPGTWSIEQAVSGSSLILMAPVRPPVNAPCPRPKTCPRLFGGWMTCVPPGYTGRKRGQVVRTRTIISQAHSFHWLGSFGNRGNGRAPRGTASGPLGHWSVSQRAPVSTSTRAAPARWSIWHGGRSLRSRWLRFRDPRQRLHRPRSSARAGAAGTCLPISPNSARKARSCAASTTVQKCRLAPRACRAAWW